MKIYHCARVCDARDTWFEIVLPKTGNGISVVHSGQGKWEFYGRDISTDYTKRLIYDTDLMHNFSHLYECLRSLFRAAVGEEEYQQTYPRSVRSAMLGVMGEIETINRNSEGLLCDGLYGYYDKYFSLLEKHKITAVTITQTGSGIDGTYHAGGEEC